MVLAVDALSGATPGSDIFRGGSLPLEFPEIGLDCGCEAGAHARGRVSTRIEPHTSVSSKPSASARR